MHRRLKESNACAKNCCITNKQNRHCKPIIIKDLKKSLNRLFAGLSVDIAGALRQSGSRRFEEVLPWQEMSFETSPGRGGYLMPV